MRRPIKYGPVVIGITILSLLPAGVIAQSALAPALNANGGRVTVLASPEMVRLPEAELRSRVKALYDSSVHAGARPSSMRVVDVQSGRVIAIYYANDLE